MKTQWITTLLAVTFIAGSAAAIQPVTWTHTTEADFQAGENDDTVVTSLGDIKLATGNKVLAETPDDVTVFYDLQRIGEQLYIAAGPQGRLLKQEGEDLVEIALLEEEQIFALTQSNGELYVAISGDETSRIAVLREGELQTYVELADVRYVWDIEPLPGDAGVEFVLATGTEGQVLLVGADQSVTQILDTKQTNVLSLAIGAGAIYAGTDTDGLIYRLRFNTQTSEYETFVIYDAGEPEIAALLVTGDGIVYAGTADAEQARPGRLEEPADEETGRPEGETDEDEDDEDVDEAVAEDIEADADEPKAPEAQPLSEAEAETPVEPEPVVEEEVEQPASPPPTPEQYDALRALMRKQLLAARKSGTLVIEGLQSGAADARPATSAAQRARPTRPQPQRKDGNAVYRIDTDGFVREVFRESVMILRLIQPQPDGPLFVATGNEGQVYRVDLNQNEVSVIVDLDCEQVVGTLAQPDGSIFLTTANPAQLIELDDDYAPTGTYTSDVLDADQVSLFGTLTLTATLPDASSVTLETRSGNTVDPDAAAWSSWSTAQVFMPNDQWPALQPREMKIASPPARFLQYRLTLSGNVADSPAVERVELTYVTPNLQPDVTSLTAAYSETDLDDLEASPDTDMNVSWEAVDPNGDPILYKLEYQPAGSDKFLLLADDLAETSYSWATHLVPDGRYLLRVTADDRLANPAAMALTDARLGDAVLIDNTPPTLEAKFEIDPPQASNLKPQAFRLHMTGKVTDTYSKIARLAYRLDNDEQYTPILPDDLIFDSTTEAFSITIPRLAPGPHVVNLRTADARGNVTYQSILLDN